MRRGRPTQPLELTQQEGSDLLRTVRQRKAPYQAVLRSRIILGCANGQTNTVVAQELGITTWTVGKWRSRFLKDRLPGLEDVLYA